MLCFSNGFSYVFLARRSLLSATKSCNVFVFTLSCFLAKFVWYLANCLLGI